MPLNLSILFAYGILVVTTYLSTDSCHSALSRLSLRRVILSTYFCKHREINGFIFSLLDAGRHAVSDVTKLN